MHWHVYRREHIKPELRGRLIYVLEISNQPGQPLVRDIFDPTGKEFPCNTREQQLALLERKNNGIVFVGVNKAAVYDLVTQDPPIQNTADRYLDYNSSILENSLEFLLGDSSAQTQALPVEISRFAIGVASKKPGVLSAA